MIFNPALSGGGSSTPWFSRGNVSATRAATTPGWPARAAGYRLDCSRSEWFDLWHDHPDFTGEGNRGWKHRRRHLAAAFTILRRVALQAAGCPRPAQVWLVVDPSDSAQDAIYVHTPNPNADNFPYTFEGVQWDVAAPGPLTQFLTDPTLQLGRSQENWPLYWVRPREPAQQVASVDEERGILSE